MKFSVIVPFLNEELHIESCIRALEAQSIERNEYELLFIDNGSVDASANIVQRYNSIRYARESIRDAYVARNTGSRLASGDILLFIDADCIPDTRLIEAYAKLFRDPEIDLAFGRLSFPKNGSSWLRYYEDYNRSKMKLMSTCLPRETCYGHAGNMAIRASVFTTLGGFSTMPIVGDADIVQQYLSRYPDKRFAYLDSAEVVHVEVDSSIALFKKLYAYGRYSGTYQHHADFRSATMKEKLLTVQTCYRDYHFSPRQCASLLCVLAVQNVFFSLGHAKTCRGSAA